MDTSPPQGTTARASRCDDSIETATETGAQTQEDAGAHVQPTWKAMLQSALDEAHAPAAAADISADASDSAICRTFAVLSTEMDFTNPISGKTYHAAGHGATKQEAEDRAWDNIVQQMRESENIARIPQRPPGVGQAGGGVGDD